MTLVQFTSVVSIVIYFLGSDDIRITVIFIMAQKLPVVTFLSITMIK